MLGVRAGELPDPEREREHRRAVHVPGVSVLDELLEFVPERGRDLDRRARGLHRAAHEGPDRVGTCREFVVRSEFLEVRLLLGREANSEEVGRGSTSSSGPHGV